MLFPRLHILGVWLVVYVVYVRGVALHRARFHWLSQARAFCSNVLFSHANNFILQYTVTAPLFTVSDHVFLYITPYSGLSEDHH